MTRLRQGGRPTLSEQEIERIQIRISLTLYLGKDDGLIEWFDSIAHGKRARYVKMALRQGRLVKTKSENKDEDLISDSQLDSLLGTL